MALAADDDHGAGPMMHAVLAHRAAPRLGEPPAAGKLAVAARGDVAAFEADDPGSLTRSGRSVTVTGRCRQDSHTGEISRLRRQPLVSWAPGDKDQFIFP